MDGVQGTNGQEDKHRDAVANTLSWAEEAAAGGDYAGAIAWLDTITAIGDRLPSPYGSKRSEWEAEIRARAQPE